MAWKADARSGIGPISVLLRVFSNLFRAFPRAGEGLHGLFTPGASPMRSRARSMLRWMADEIEKSHQEEKL